MKKLLLAGLLCSPFYHLSGQQLGFARTHNQPGTEASIRVVYDHADNVLVTGYTQIIAGLGGTNGSSNTWVRKYNTVGQFLWEVQTNYTGTINQAGAEVTGISVDSENNTYITGVFFSEFITLGGVTYTVPVNGSLNLFYAKITPAGVVQWIKGIGEDHYASNTCMGSTITVTPDDELILTGAYFKGVIIGNDTLAGDPASTGGMTPYGFYAKLDRNGTPVWAKRFSNLVTGAYNSFGGIASTAVDDDGNLFFMMGLDSAVVIGNDTISSAYLTTVVKTDPSGEFIRAVIPQASYNFTREITLDKCGNVLLLGEFINAIQLESTVLTAASSRDIFVAKLDNDLDLVWMKNFYSLGGNRSGGIACNYRNDVYFTFDFWGEISYGGSYTPSPVGTTDAILFKLDKDGNTVWHKQSTGTGNISVSNVSVSPSNKAVMAGRYMGQEKFDGTVINSTPTNLSDVWFAGYTDTMLAALPANCQDNLGLQTFTNSHNMLIYPNPATEHISITVHGTTQHAQLTITDLSGRVVLSSRLVETTAFISVAAFPEGMYIVQLQLPDGTSATGKITVKH